MRRTQLKPNMNLQFSLNNIAVEVNGNTPFLLIAVWPWDGSSQDLIVERKSIGSNKKYEIIYNVNNHITIFTSYSIIYCKASFTTSNKGCKSFLEKCWL